MKKYIPIVDIYIVKWMASCIMTSASAESVQYKIWRSKRKMENCFELVKWLKKGNSFDYLIDFENSLD